MGGVGDRPNVLQVAGRIEEVGGHDQGGPLVDSLGESLWRDGHPVLAGHEFDLEVGSGEPLVADRREVELPDQDLVATRRQRQPGGESGQGD